MKGDGEQPALINGGFDHHAVGDVQERAGKHPPSRREDEDQSALIDDEATAPTEVSS
jgi:hypothetical protein